MKEAFNLFDKDGGGTISAPEMRQCLRSIGQNYSEYEVKKMIDEIDQDDNGEIDFDEFCMLMAKNMSEGGNGNAKLIDLFDCFDRDGEGSIDVDEFMNTMYILSNMGEAMTDEEVKEMFVEATPSRNGVLTKDEFIAMMTAKPSNVSRSIKK